MTELITRNDDWTARFMGQLDAALEGIEKMSECGTSAFGDVRFLTDKEGSAWLKVSRRTLQDYRNNGMVSYYQLGGKILYKESDIEKMVMDGYREAYRKNS